MGFKGIVGHEDIIAHFKSSIETGNVAHAYIISGDAGSGKKALAYAFAETLECEAGGTEACGTCQSCLQVSTGNYPDIITVTHEKPNLISVDEVRDQLINTIDIKPYKGKYKIYIIPDAELLNVQAQNAMLKTIEEPPAYAVILLLTTNLDKLLETVKSRCLKLQTKPIRERDVLAYLTNVMGLTKEKAYFCLDLHRVILERQSSSQAMTSMRRSWIRLLACWRISTRWMWRRLEKRSRISSSLRCL